MHPDTGGGGARWAQAAARVAAGVTVLHLLGILGFGFMWVTTDWRVLECFDGTEPACDEPSRSGLSAVRASSWLLAVMAVAAAVGALVLAIRLRRAAQLAPLLLLCVTSGVIAQALWSRL